MPKHDFKDYRSEYYSIPIEEIEDIIKDFFKAKVYIAAMSDAYFGKDCHFVDCTEDSQDDDTWYETVMEWQKATEFSCRIEHLMFYLARQGVIPYGEYLLWN